MAKQVELPHLLLQPAEHVYMLSPRTNQEDHASNTHVARPWEAPQSSQIEHYQVTGQDYPSIVSVRTEMLDCSFKWIQATVSVKC